VGEHLSGAYYVRPQYTQNTVGMAPDSRKLGKHPPRIDNRTLKFGSYLTPQLPTPPPRVDYTRGFNINWGMMLNDQLGLCVEAAKGHGEQIWSLCNGRMITVPDSTILANYEANGGYVPGDQSTDDGENELDSLKAWRKNASGLSKLTAFAAVDPKTKSHIQTGIWLFGFAYIGFQVSQACMDQNYAGQIWDTVPDDGGIIGGHAVVVPMYDMNSDTFTAITWGMRQQLTWRFWQKYVDEIYILLSPAWLNSKGFNPQGFDLEALQSDLAAVTK
jgi:hypothetical protein